MATLTRFSSGNSRVGLLSFTLIALALTACTKKNEAGVVKIRMPSSVADSGAPVTGKSVTTLANGENWNTNLNPNVGSQLNCFAVFVAGSGLTAHSCDVEEVTSNGETLTPIKFGLFAGLVPAGEEISFPEVSTGIRVFHVVGFQSVSAADCRTSKLPEVQEPLLSEPFHIATHTALIRSGANDPLVIQPKFNSGKKVRTCKFAGYGDSNGGNSTILFGNGRDGKLETNASLASFTSAETFNGVIGLSHTPASAGSASSKVLGATRQISSIDASGRTLTLATSFQSIHFDVGDEVIWHVSAGNSNLGAPDDPTLGACGSSLSRGRYGITTIQAVSGNQVTVAASVAMDPSLVKNSNLMAPVSNPNFCRISLTRIPNFEEIKIPSSTAAILTPPVYDSSKGTGGLLALRVRKLEIDGTLSLRTTGLGYAGGPINTAGSSVASEGQYGRQTGNDSGGGAFTSSAGAGGAGAGEGGSSSATVLGGNPLNYCTQPAQGSTTTGLNTSCSTNENGELRCWGQSTGGSLGESGTASRRITPSKVTSPLLFDQVSAGSNHMCAITRKTNQLYCWGGNTFGQLGDGTTADKATPTHVPSGHFWSHVSTGSNATCGLTINKALMCWGRNTNFLLGDGTAVNRSSPTAIDAGVSYQSVSVGNSHACGVTATGILKCWGVNTLGKLGNGNSVDQSTPVIVNAASSYKEVSVGENHSCALTTGGAVHCFGHNTFGQVGNGTFAAGDGSIYVAMIGGAQSIEVGLTHSCAIDTTKRLWCWGNNGSGQLGDGTTSNSSSAVAIDITRSYNSISAGSTHTCAIDASGGLRCWGDNSVGQLGVGSIYTSSSVPVPTRTQSTCSPLQDQKMFFGGGGGGGSSSPGANGGGLVLIFAKEVVGSGSLLTSSNGDEAGSAGLPGGAGGGGTVGFVTRRYNLTGASLLRANGANGSAGSLGSGGGGGGTIEMKYCAVESTGVSVSMLLEDGGTGGTGASSGARGIASYWDNTSTCSAN